MIGPPITTELRQYCQTCGRATLTIICAPMVGHGPVARCAVCEHTCPVCESSSCPCDYRESQ